MFVLEESQLLEDTIKDQTVLRLYKTLRQNEASNDREPLVEGILNDEKCHKLIEFLVDFLESSKVDVNDPTLQMSRLSPEQKDRVCEELNLEQNDVASLTLVVAAALNQLFVIDNYTGPTSQDSLDSYQTLPQAIHRLKRQINYKSLSLDGSEVYHRITSPWLLRLTQLYWTFLTSLGCSRRLLELEFLVWKHRYLTIHLMVLVEPAESLGNELRKVQDFIFDHHIINDIKENKTQLVRFNIVELCCELAQSCLLRDGITASRKILDYASEISGISIKHTGVLGRRTKFQSKDIPQLLVTVKRADIDGNTMLPIAKHDTPDEDDVAGLPNDIKLDDDTLLPDIAFKEESAEVTDQSLGEDLSAEAQLIMLSNLDHILRTEVMEESLKDEWTQAYLRAIIKASSIWSVKYKALAHRSVVEKKHMRKMDRALLQMEELIKLAEKSEKSSNKRMRSFYSVLPLARWQVQRSLGDISYDLALFKNALEIYLAIEYWEGIIRCYAAIGQTVKAEQIIRQELEKEETPYLYCLLGDATDDINHYEKAWTLSKGRFARAKKSVGTHYYVRKQYEKAIENYELAISANPTNISILSLLAYSCLTIERYERAAECYRNLTYYDDANFLAWNNLSKAYIKLNQKERAWRTLREAIKCNYEEWRVWDNFMLISIQVGAYDDVITAWHRLIDLRSSHRDDQILEALTHELFTLSYSRVDSEFMKLLHDALKLLARINSTSACSPRVWVCYFKLLIREFELTNKKAEKALPKLDVDAKVSKITNALQRATPTTLLIDADWYKIPEKVDKMLDSYDELVDCYRFAVEVLGPRHEVWNQWKNFKLSANNVMKLLNKQGYQLGK